MSLSSPQRLTALLAAAGIALAVGLTPITTSDAQSPTAKASADLAARHGHAHGGVKHIR